MPANRSITAEWQPPRWWSRYNRGVVTRMTGLDSVSGIWRRTETGEIRIYTADAIDGKTVVVNGLPNVMRAAGRFGLLHISE